MSKVITITSGKGGVGVIERRERAMLDAGRAVADDIVEIILELVDDARHAFLAERVLVARLRGREDVEVVVALILDQRLIELGVAVDHIDEIEDDAAFAPHDQIEIAQPDIEIDDDRPVPAQCQPGCDRGGGGRLSDTSFAGSEHDYLSCQKDLLFPPAEDDPIGPLRVSPSTGAVAMMSVNFA